MQRDDEARRHEAQQAQLDREAVKKKSPRSADLYNRFLRALNACKDATNAELETTIAIIGTRVSSEHINADVALLTNARLYMQNMLDERKRRREPEER